MPQRLHGLPEFVPVTIADWPTAANALVDEPLLSGGPWSAHMRDGQLTLGLLDDGPSTMVDQKRDSPRGGDGFWSSAAQRVPDGRGTQESYASLLAAAELAMATFLRVELVTRSPMCLVRRDRYYPGPDLVLMLRDLVTTWNQWCPPAQRFDADAVAAAAREISVRTLAGSTALSPEEEALVEEAELPQGFHAQMSLLIPCVKLGDVAPSLLALLILANYSGIGLGTQSGLGGCDVTVAAGSALAEAR